MADKLVVPQAIMSDDSQKRPVFDCLTPALRERAETIPSQLMNKSSDELERMIEPSPMLRQLKMCFWREYEKACFEGRDVIRASAIYESVCAKNLFYYYLGRPEVFAWILSPVSSFETKVHETLDFCLDRMRNEIVKAPLFDERGKFDSQAAGIIMSAFKVLDARVNGSPLQRILQKNEHVHKTEGGSMSKDDLRRELDEIHSRLQMSRLPPPRDVGGSSGEET